MSTRLTTGDLDLAVYDRQRAASRDDRVLQTIILPAWADRYEDVLYVEAVERGRAAAVRQVRAEMSERHATMRAALRRLEATR